VKQSPARRGGRRGPAGGDRGGAWPPLSHLVRAPPVEEAGFGSPPSGEAGADLPPGGQRAGYLFWNDRPLRKPPRRPDPRGTVRRGREHRKSRPPVSGRFNYPKVCLTGRWLEDAGFLQGRSFEVEVFQGRLMLTAV
jgi:hypothetical protein